jgi:hypothetical protein
VQEQPTEPIDFRREEPFIAGNLERGSDGFGLTAPGLDTEDGLAPSHLISVRLEPGTQRDLDACVQPHGDRQPSRAGYGAIPFLGPTEERQRELPPGAGTIPQFT